MDDKNPDSQEEIKTTENAGVSQAPKDSSEIGSHNAVGSSVNQIKKFFDMKIAGFTAVLSIYLTLIVREIIDKSLVANGFGLPVDQYVLILFF